MTPGHSDGFYQRCIRHHPAPARWRCRAAAIWTSRRNCIGSKAIQFSNDLQTARPTAGSDHDLRTASWRTWTDPSRAYYPIIRWASSRSRGGHQHVSTGTSPTEGPEHLIHSSFRRTPSRSSYQVTATSRGIALSSIHKVNSIEFGDARILDDRRQTMPEAYFPTRCCQGLQAGAFTCIPATCGRSAEQRRQVTGNEMRVFHATCALNRTRKAAGRGFSNSNFDRCSQVITFTN